MDGDADQDRISWRDRRRVLDLAARLRVLARLGHSDAADLMADHDALIAVVRRLDEARAGKAGSPRDRDDLGGMWRCPIA